MFAFLEGHLGEIAAVATSMLWTATALLFTAAGRRISPVWVNAGRIFLGVLLLGATHYFYVGAWWPDAPSAQIALLAVSGVVGLTIGDQALFVAFIDVGPRISSLIMTTSPLFAVAFAWMSLGERIPASGFVGIAMTVVGVAWVILDRPDAPPDGTVSRRARGLMLAFVAAGCQALGMLLSKIGMGHDLGPDSADLPPYAATFVRMSFAAVGMAPLLVLRASYLRRRRARGTFQPADRKVGLLLTACGAVVGPYLGVWMSLEAVDRTSVGVAQTLCSLTPIFILPFAAVMYHERIGIRAVLGTLLSVAGAAVLFLQPPLHG